MLIVLQDADETEIIEIVTVAIRFYNNDGKPYLCANGGCPVCFQGVSSWMCCFAFMNKAISLEFLHLGIADSSDTLSGFHHIVTYHCYFISVLLTHNTPLNL